MIKLNLKADSEEYEMIKKYLEENVSETLADKINNGVKITKDNKTLINRKDLSTFENYAYQEASKLRKNNQRMLGVHHSTVFAWAVHYFEEDSIEGKLYNEDGTEYKSAPPKPTTKTETKPQPKKPENNQATLFDLFSLDDNKKEETEEIEPDDEEETEEIEKEYEQEQQKIEEKVEPQNVQIVATSTEKVIVDTDTGEVLSDEQIKKSFDKETMYMLYTILEGKMDMR